jgi:very-short-patch-repair endonuclease
MTNKYKVRSFICLGCKNNVEKRCRQGTLYCSINCYRVSKRPNRMNGLLLKCDSCTKEFYKTKSSINTNNFCSIECYNTFQSKNKLKYNCKVCSSEFYWSKSRIKQQQPKYCSIKCRNKCLEWKENSVIAGNLKQQNSKSRTKLEILGKSILLELGVDFEEQVLIENKFIVDVLLKNKKIVLQWDGDYWHGYKKNKDGLLDERQIKRVKLDKSQDAYMYKCGYKVLRFWEHDVYKQKEKVIEIIKKSI